MSFKTPEASFASSRGRRTSERGPRLRLDSDDFENSFTFDNVNFSNVEDSIRRFLEIGDTESACHWIDTAYARETEGDARRDPIKLAKFIKLLSNAHQWPRIATLFDNHDKFQQRHVYFAYFQLNAYLQMKYYAGVTTAKVAHLIDLPNAPVPTPTVFNGVDASLTGYEAPITPEQKVELDEMARRLNLHSAILTVIGAAFIHQGNRDAAARCLRRALLKDPHSLHAEQLILQHRLLNSDDMKQVEKLVTKRDTVSGDPRILTEKARKLYSIGDAKGAVRVTEGIFEKYGWYLPCLLIHVNSLVMLDDADALFLLAHNLVDAMPDHVYSWYTVACYYHCCNQPNAKILAKQYMNKATQPPRYNQPMNDLFGEGFIALGHILAADSENDQALSCYYKAARIMENHFEPYLYIAIQYSKNSVKFANNFLNDAKAISPENPIIFQEQACILYGEKQYMKAYKLFDRALRLVLVQGEVEKLPELTEETHTCVQSRKYNIEAFWAPLLNNLGHCCRKIEKFEEAAIYHQAALLLKPMDSQALTASAIALTMTGKDKAAVQQINKALSIHPFDPLIRDINDVIMKLSAEFQVIAIDDDIDAHHGMSLDDLEELFKSATQVNIKGGLLFHNKSIAKRLSQTPKISSRPVRREHDNEEDEDDESS